MKEEVIQTSAFASNGTMAVDYKGEIADKNKTGGWMAAPFIIVNEVAERLAYYSIAVNMMMYLVVEMHQPLAEAATHVSNWIGTTYMLTLFGAFMADAYLGRFRTIMSFSCIYAAGMLLLAISGAINLRPPHCTKRPCPPATMAATNFLYGALALIALGTGSIKPCVSSFGADQFDESDPTELQKKQLFFNWFFFSINIGAIFGMTFLVYVQVQLGWSWGFGIPMGATIASILLLVAGWRRYRYHKPMGSAFTRFFQVIVASVRNHVKGVEVGPNLYEVDTTESDIHGCRRLAHTQGYRYLDKAAVMTDPENTNNRWKVCTITQVEEFKSLIRIIPVCASSIPLGITLIQLSTFFIAQAHVMDRALTPNFNMPSSWILAISTINTLIVVPIYEKFAVPFLHARTGHPRGLTSLQRMGAGLFLSICAMAAAATVEMRRKSDASRGVGSSVFWLFPQCFLMGMAEIFASVGQLEFFYEEAAEGARSISCAVFLSGIGIGSLMNTAIVKTVERFSGGEKGWLKDGAHTSRLDYYYWLLTGINAVNFLWFLCVSRRYWRRKIVPETEPAGETSAHSGKWDKTYYNPMGGDDVYLFTPYFYQLNLFKF